MGRRIYIIPKTMKVKAALKDAKAANCPEIVHGIPPALGEIIDEASLPMAFEEPEVAIPPTPRDHGAEIDDLEARLKVLEARNN